MIELLRISALSDEELQDEIDTFSHVVRHLGIFRVHHTEKTDSVLDHLIALEKEQETRKEKCPHIHTKRLVLPANKRKRFDEPFAYHCTDCNRTFGEEPEAKL